MWSPTRALPEDCDHNGCTQASPNSIQKPLLRVAVDDYAHAIQELMEKVKSLEPVPKLPQISLRNCVGELQSSENRFLLPGRCDVP